MESYQSRQPLPVPALIEFSKRNDLKIIDLIHRIEFLKELLNKSDCKGQMFYFNFKRLVDEYLEHLSNYDYITFSENPEISRRR